MVFLAKSIKQSNKFEYVLYAYVSKGYTYYFIDRGQNEHNDQKDLQFLLFFFFSK
jgi:hypothetical protein